MPQEVLQPGSPSYVQTGTNHCRGGAPHHLMALPPSPPELRGPKAHQMLHTATRLAAPLTFPETASLTKAPNNQAIHLSSLRLALGEKSKFPESVLVLRTVFL